MFQIDKAFNPETLNVHGFYQKPGVGLYIPLYQREYSWDKDNIDQLLDDVTQGIFSITENKDEIRFLGTVIAVQVQDQRSIFPIDKQGLPSLIENIIDGQQRLSTIALFSTLLYHHIWVIQKKIEKSKDENIEKQVNETCNYWKKKLLDVFSLDLQRGTPHRKPKIIRGNKDQWTKDGDINSSYQSDVANYLANFINYIDDHSSIDKLPSFIPQTRTGENLKRIDTWLKKIVIKAHEKQTEEFITANEVLSQIKQDYIWQYERQELEELVKEKDYSSSKTLSALVSSLVQLFAVSHYLLERCCFTIIKPMNEDWAFDMFQSLNATGTPLTAIETFKPSVVNTATNNKQEFKGSAIEESFEKVDALFSEITSAARKSSLTKEFLTSLALTIEGKKLSSHFSQQRKWLTDLYAKDCGSYEEKEAFIHFFGDYAEFYKKVWLDYKGENGLPIDVIASHPDADLASVLILYLKESNHKMSITILGRLYSDIIRGKTNSIHLFVEAVKAVARFYSIWRSSQSNSGLDVQYRNFLKRPIREDKTVIVEDSNAWLDTPTLNVVKLEHYFDEILRDKNLLDKASWKSKALVALKYNKAKSVCKLALFCSAHNTIADMDNLGLMKAAKSGTSKYLNLSQWISKDLGSIEHIAPEKGISEWDNNLYTDEEWYHSIGNLTLLPLKINSSAGNKGWKEKYIYYQYLSEGDLQRQQELKHQALNLGVTLSDKTLILLQKANYNHHILPIVALGEDANWDTEFVQNRGERILDIFWQSFLVNHE
ncbi:MAG: DUF262 domain-containing protein [Aureispira sp.]